MFQIRLITNLSYATISIYFCLFQSQGKIMPNEYEQTHNRYIIQQEKE